MKYFIFLLVGLIIGLSSGASGKVSKTNIASIINNREITTEQFICNNEYVHNQDGETEFYSASVVGNVVSELNEFLK